MADPTVWTRGFVRSIVHAQAFPAGDVVVDAPRLIGEFGFASIETVAVPRRAVPFRPDGAVLVLLGGLPLLRAGLSLSAIGPERRDAVDLAKRLIDDALDCTATRLLVTSGPDVDPPVRPAATAALVESLTELAGYAADRRPDLLLTLEPTDRTLRHRQLVGPTGEALAVVDAVARQHPNIEVNLDVSHLLQLGEDPLEMLRLAARRSRHVHLANCLLSDPSHPLYGECHPPFDYPGSEVGPDQLASVLQTMYAAGYADPDWPTTLGIEVVPPAGTDPWTVLADACRAVDHAMTAAIPTETTNRPEGRA